jgi:hypothetical protein
MRSFLGKSVSSVNENKLHGIRAEIGFRDHIAALGFANNVSPGGWLIRTSRVAQFGSKTIALFPEVVQPDTDYSPTRPLGAAPTYLEPVGFSFQRIGVESYLCRPIVSLGTPANLNSWLSWTCVRLGKTGTGPSTYVPLSSVLVPFHTRTRTYQPLKYNKDVSGIPDIAVPTQFSAEALRVAVQCPVFCEMSDIDGVLFGSNVTYPLEIKEKTAANDKDMGDYFGLDVGPFVKLAYYAAQQGQMESIFVVHEIKDKTTRAHIAWWFITFEDLAKFASWNPRSGGTNMQGGGSTVIRIPKCHFKLLDAAALAGL